MAITASKTSDRLRVVHALDPDVDAFDTTADGWISIDKATARPGATCLAIGPRSKRELMAADGDMSEGGLNAGIAAYELAIAGLQEVGEWQGDRLMWRDLNRAAARELVEELNVPAAIWQLGALVRQLSTGWADSDEAAAPLALAAAGSGPPIGG